MNQEEMEDIASIVHKNVKKFIDEWAPGRHKDHDIMIGLMYGCLAKTKENLEQCTEEEFTVSELTKLIVNAFEEAIAGIKKMKLI